MWQSDTISLYTSLMASSFLNVPGLGSKWTSTLGRYTHIGRTISQHGINVTAEISSEMMKSDIQIIMPSAKPMQSNGQGSVDKASKLIFPFSWQARPTSLSCHFIFEPVVSVVIVQIIICIYRPFEYKRVYLPLCKVADTPFQIQGDNYKARYIHSHFSILVNIITVVCLCAGGQRPN